MKRYALLLGLLCGCNGSLPPNVVQGGVATIETALCIVNTAAKDYQAGMSDAQMIADCIQLCATDAATIARVLDANRGLMLAQKGMVCK